MNVQASAKQGTVDQALEAGLPISGFGAIAKRAIDIAGSTFMLLLLLPILICLAVLIKLQDRGPALYRRRVVGPGGKFDALKLRTMHTAADEVLRDNPALRREFQINFKLKNDPRVTALGRNLRKSSMDELPQLWNVLKGQMSLVGPRMISPGELEKYGPNGWIFDAIRPGLTGYWQVYGRQEVSYNRRVEMDLFYLKNWSLLLDFKILLRTPGRVIRGMGAY